jgi:hypothetical protein
MGESPFYRGSQLVASTTTSAHLSWICETRIESWLSPHRDSISGFEAIQTGTVAAGGATDAGLHSSLLALRDAMSIPVPLVLPSSRRQSDVVE